MARAALVPFEHEGDRWMLIAYAPPRPAALASLTGGEFAIVERWMAGASMRAIATERAVRMRTVANQIASAYKKLRVTSRTELICLVHELGDRAGAPAPR